jgi:hypothetical protein
MKKETMKKELKKELSTLRRNVPIDKPGNVPKVVEV